MRTKPLNTAQPGLGRLVLAGLLLAGGAAFSVASADGTERAPDLDTIPDNLTLEETLDLVRDHSPRLAAERAAVDRAVAEQIQAGRLPNPELEIEVERPSWGDTRRDREEYEVLVEQPLLLRGQRGARVDLAEMNADAARSEFRAAAAGLLTETRQTFVELLAHQERLAAFEALRQDLRRIQDNVSGRVEAGDTSPYDLTRVRIEISTIESEIIAARDARDEAAARLAALFGARGDDFRVDGDLDPSLMEANYRSLWPEAEENLPELISARQRNRTSNQAVDVARRERPPVPSVGLGAVQDREDRGGAVLLSFSMDIPVFDDRRGTVAEAQADSLGTRLELDATRRGAQAELQRAVREFENRRVALERYEREVVGELPELREQAEDAYTLGQLGIIELLDAFESVVDAQVNYIDLLELLALAEISVLAASGRIDQHVD